MRKIVVLGILMLMGANIANAQTEKVKYGDFQQWITRTIHESAVIGGATRTQPRRLAVGYQQRLRKGFGRVER